MTGVWRREEMVRRTLVEAIGTFLLVLIGPGAMMVNRVTDGAITHLGVALAFEMARSRISV
ncbi:MAG: hypothetical protein ACYC2K_16685, partial [Gemmatimonadales bacterium]